MNWILIGAGAGAGVDVNVNVNVLTMLLLVIVDLDMAPCKPTTLVDSHERACGRELADLLQKYCSYGYNYDNASLDLAGKKNYGRKKRGITQECCLQPCARHELLEYCYNGSSLADELRKMAVNATAATTTTANFKSADKGENFAASSHRGIYNCNNNLQNTRSANSNSNSNQEYLSNNEIDFNLGDISNCDDTVDNATKPNSNVNDKLPLVHSTTSNSTGSQRWNVGMKTNRYYIVQYPYVVNNTANRSTK